MPIKVVLVDDHELVIEGIKAMLAPFADRVEVAGAATRASEAMAMIDELDPDIVVCDVRLGSTSGLDLCQAARDRRPKVKVILLSVYDDEQYLFQAMRVGASGYLLKGISSDELVRQIESAQAGGIAIDSGLAARAAETAARLRRSQFWPGAGHGLTQRESEILALLVKGMSNRGIANALGIAEETVKTHVSSIYRKLEVKDRTTAVATALREGIFQ